MAYIRKHKGCGGEITSRKCQRCGKVWSVTKYYLASDIEDVKETSKFSPSKYRQRIRERRDIGEPKR